MGGEVIIFISIFLMIFGISYLYLTTRNKERLALIEKGAEASIFVKGKKEGTAPFWKVLILNIALLLLGIGLAIFIAALLVEIGLDEDVAYPGTIFIMAGLGLFLGFTLTKKLDKED
ncbi:DUF6249 domain-containing protein [Muriicola soli]|uniref:DUF6249 domain-containing protein n=1 Tax=Muriicola soli TaxID=2507538 RepID=A0A411E7F8_9FLAO|nr:DUF6249 domain-containing protein [Muriicola soli]QBA63588.1 hypothetical protein EQY75_02900 [Muriicola soli]